MDKSDHLLYAAIDPPTGKTEPPEAPPRAAPEPGMPQDADPLPPEQGQADAPAAAEDERAPSTKQVASERPHAQDADAEAELWAPLSIPPEPPRRPWNLSSPWPEPAPAKVACELPPEAQVADSTSRVDSPEPLESSTPVEVPPRSEATSTAAPVWEPTRFHVLAPPAFSGEPPHPTSPLLHAAQRAAAPAELSSAQPLRSRINLTDLVERAAKVGAIVVAGWFCAVLILIAAYRFINPPFSSLMAMQWLTGTSIHKQWVPLERISPNLIRAVVVSEDGRFCEHWGIDFVEIAHALKRTRDGVPRGASTITMQVAKNLFLWPAKSYVRKMVEVPLTYAIELAWPKRRILEVYLNIAEWGPGVFGAEAAARTHFNQPASRLSSRQAAQLAVALPSPLRRDAGDPGPWTSRRATVIQRRMGHEPEAVACLGPGG